MLPTEHQLNYQRREKRENITILIKFCAIGSEERITLATGTQLTIKARSTSIAKLESNESIIKIEDCGIDPITF